MTHLEPNANALDTSLGRGRCFNREQIMESVRSAAPLANNAEPLNQVGVLLGQLLQFELNSADVDLAVASAKALELTALLQRSLEVLLQLEQLNRPPEQESASFAALEEVTLVRPVPSERSVSRLEDVCFAAALELNRVLRELSCARGLDEVLSAAETAQRKLGRALHAVVASAVAQAGGAPALAAEPSLRRRDELESALAVRPLFAEFRRILRRAEDGNSESVLTALRYAAGALATLTASPHYAVMRVSDRSLLRRLRERLLEWSRSGKYQREGLQLLDDIWTCADLLRDINRRQELRAHDTQLVRELSVGSAGARTEWLLRLTRLSGLDDTLDALIARALACDIELDTALELDIVVRLSYLA